MNWFEALIAGVIQGLTEFLPISSSGHLVIYNTLLASSKEGGGSGGGLAFTVFLHLATLLAVILVYKKDVLVLISAFFGAIGDFARGKPAFKTPGRRYLLMVIIGTIPAVIAGLAVTKLDLDNKLENIFVVAVMLIVTALFMFSIDKIKVKKGGRTAKDATLKSVLLVGILQGIAILPGLSRSGSTIFGGVLGGLKKEFAVRFAFILSIPVILGAALIELHGVAKAGGFDIAPLNLVIGAVAAFFCGLLAIKLIKVLIRSKKFYVFGIYCLCASVFAFLVGFGVIHG